MQSGNVLYIFMLLIALITTIAFAIIDVAMVYNEYWRRLPNEQKLTKKIPKFVQWCFRNNRKATAIYFGCFLVWIIFYIVTSTGSFYAEITIINAANAFNDINWILFGIYIICFFLSMLPVRPREPRSPYHV